MRRPAARALLADTLPRGLALPWSRQLDSPGFVQRLRAFGVLQRTGASGESLAEGCALAKRLAALPGPLRAKARMQVDSAPGRMPLARQFAQARDSAFRA